MRPKIKEINIWEIPRSDKRDRCGTCLKVFHRSNIRFREGNPDVLRFPDVCLGCKKV